MKQTVFEVYYGDDGIPRISMPEGSDAAVMDLTSAIARMFANGDQLGLQILFSVTTHFFAQSGQGDFLEEYIDNLRKYVSEYNKHYKMAVNEMKKTAS